MRRTLQATDKTLRLKSENKTGHDIGDIMPAVRSDLEDELVTCIDHVHRSGDVSHFQWFIGKYGAVLGYPEVLILATKASAETAWAGVHTWSTELKRLEPYWEHSANWLKDRGAIPGKGGDFLGM